MKAFSKISRPQLGRARGRAVLATMVGAAAAVTMAVLPASPASAHCDSVNGPVVTAAQSALDAKNVKLILPYVQPAQEQELTAVFDQTINIRQRGAEVRKVADHYFFETAVRLHRVGEGASYTGLKDEEVTDPALLAAEKSLQQGNPDEVINVLNAALRAEVAERYHAVLEAREAEKANPNVETSRARVEAELSFEKYTLGIGGAINEVTHEEAAGGEGGHEH